MAEKRRGTIINLPVKIIFTEEGINFFIKNKKKLNKFKMADDAEAYGILFNQFSPPSIQQMLLIGYISKVEISSHEFLSKRQDVMDLSKLLVYGTLYEQFSNIIFSKLLASDLIKNWNRLNPGNTIDGKTKLNDSLLKKLMTENKNIVTKVKGEILTPVYKHINNNKNLLVEEKNIQLLLSEKFLTMLNPFIWFILSRFHASKEYNNLITEIITTLENFLEKSKISEYLSLMILELLSNAENTNLNNFASKIYKNKNDAEKVIYDSQIRNKILDELKERNENIHLSWKLKNKNSAMGIQNKIQVTLFNRETEYLDLRDSINDKKDLKLKGKSLTQFYKNLPETSGTNNELGLYYLSYLNDACNKVNVRFESNVNHINTSDLTVINLNLNL